MSMLKQAYFLSYCNLLFYVADANFTIVEYMKDISPTLGEYFENATVTTPGLVESLEESLNNPQQVNRGFR